MSRRRRRRKMYHPRGILPALSTCLVILCALQASVCSVQVISFSLLLILSVPLSLVGWIAKGI